MDQGPLTARNSSRYLLLPATHWPNVLLLSLMQMAVDLWIFRNLYMLSVCLRAGEVKKKSYNVCTRWLTLQLYLKCTIWTVMDTFRTANYSLC